MTRTMHKEILIEILITTCSAVVGFISIATDVRGECILAYRATIYSDLT